MRRRVQLREIETYYWSTVGLAWGIDVDRGEEIAFSVRLEDVGALNERLEREVEPMLTVSECDILLARPDELHR